MFEKDVTTSLNKSKYNIEERMLLSCSYNILLLQKIKLYNNINYAGDDLFRLK